MKVASLLGLAVLAAGVLLVYGVKLDHKVLPLRWCPAAATSRR